MVKMKPFFLTVVGGVLSFALVVGTSPVFAMTDVEQLAEKDMKSFEQKLGDIVLPKVEQPKWLSKQIAAEARKKAALNSRAITVTYNVSTKGNLRTSFDEFKNQANETLNSARGWARMNVSFKEVASGGMFTLVLAEASQVPFFAPGACSSQWSCRVGRNIIINQDRWISASDAWNNAGGSLRDYRHMVINHEVGHWLGHDHPSCGGNGQAAPVMLQQSIDLQGCKFNPWPLASELWSTQLGIQ